MLDRSPVPNEVVQAVDGFVDEELRDAAKFENRSPLDESGVFALHLLAAHIYSLGWKAGANAEGLRQAAVGYRRRDAERSKAAEDKGETA